MYVTQTYLGSVGDDANLYIYYLFEEYDPEQEAFTSLVEKMLAGLGEQYGSKVTLFMPQRSAANRVGAEMRQFEQLWTSLRGQLPGLLLTAQPLRQFNEQQGENFYVPFHGTEAESAADTIQAIRKAADFKLYWKPTPSPDRPAKQFGERMWDAVELKPGIFGFRVDLKKATAAVRSLWSGT